MIQRGRGMTFPNSYNRDQFTPEEEAAMDAGQAATENADQCDCGQNLQREQSDRGGWFWHNGERGITFCPECSTELPDPNSFPPTANRGAPDA